MVEYPVHSCTDVTGFALLGHCFEMAQGSGVTIRLETKQIPYHREAYEMAEMGFIPAGAYRNREYAQAGVNIVGEVTRAMQDICYDPQTSGGLLMASPEGCAKECLERLQKVCPDAAIVGSVTEKEEASIILK